MILIYDHTEYPSVKVVEFNQDTFLVIQKMFGDYTPSTIKLLIKDNNLVAVHSHEYFDCLVETYMEENHNV